MAALNFRETGRQNRAVLELQRRGQVPPSVALLQELLALKGGPGPGPRGANILRRLLGR